MSNSDFKQVDSFYPPKKVGSTMDKTHDFFCKILFTCIGLDKFYGRPKIYQSEKLPYPIQEKGNYFEPLDFNQDRLIVEYDEKFGSPGLIKPEQGMVFGFYKVHHVVFYLYSKSLMLLKTMMWKGSLGYRYPIELEWFSPCPSY